MNEIGGYMELELNQGIEYHDKALRLNLGRTSFEYILRAKEIGKIFIPFYTCDVIVKTLIRLSVKYEFYHINENLEPIFNYNSLRGDEFFLYNNYFGLKDNFIRIIARETNNLIIDNAQAFFSKPLPGIDTFYSPRKFFGVPDGGYLYTDTLLDENFKIDKSGHRFRHLIGRIESGPENYYSRYKYNESILCKQPIKKMSKITQRILKNINYSNVVKIRNRNYKYLQENIGELNKLNIDISTQVPLSYPFWSEFIDFKSLLINNKIFVVQYWPNVQRWVKPNTFEYKLASKVIHIPIDQRYTINDLKKIVRLIKKCIKK